MRTACVALITVSLSWAPWETIAQVAPKIIWVSYNDDQNDAPAADAADNGFTIASDHVYTELLRAAGADLTRHLTADGDPDANLLNQADLVIISRSVVSGQYDDEATAWNTTITAPVLMMTAYILRDNRQGFTTGNTIVDTVGFIKLKAEDPSHPVFDGVELDGQNIMVNDYAGIVTHNGIVQRGLSVNNNPIIEAGKLLATVATESDPTVGGMIIGEWQAGITLQHDGGAEANTLASHRMALLTGSRELGGIPVSTAGLFDLEADGEQLFFNAVNYMAGSNLIPPPRITSVSPRSGTEFADTSGGFSFKAISSEAIPESGITVVVNGQDVSSSLQIGTDPLSREVSFAAIQKSLAYTVDITVANPTGTRAVAVTFDTFSPGDLIFIEAENFNFGGGQFFDDIVLCNDFGGGPNGCYFDRVSEPGVDALDVNGAGDNRDIADVDSLFRFGSGGSVEESETFPSTDIVRNLYANADPGSNGPIQDFDVERINPGDWWNYTRTFEAGAYSANLRVSASADAEFEMGLVTSNAAQGNQTVELIGSFVIAGRSGYQTVSLSDASGALQGFQLDGQQTLRLAAVSGTTPLLNYMLLTPYVEPPVEKAEFDQIALNANGTVTITWTGGGVLETTASLASPDWQPVAGATSPYTVTPEDNAFFRFAP